MPITTIEQALNSIGKTLAKQEMADRARAAISSGSVLEVTVLVSPAKDGAAVTLHSIVASDRASHGRLIKLK